MTITTDIADLRNDVARLRATVTRLSRRVDEQWRAVVDRRMPGEYLAELLALPGLRGCWPMSGISTGGDVYDASGQGRTLTENGNPSVGLHNGVMPYYAFDGTGDYLDRADEAALDITGDEGYIGSAIQGLTMCCWAWFDAWPGSSRGIMGKYDSGADQRSYALHLQNDQLVRAGVSGDGANPVGVDSTALALDTWYFLAMRFTPSTELALWVNDNKTTEANDIPATLYVGTANFEIASRDGGTLLMTGRYGIGALYCAALPDRTIARLYNRGLPLFS